MRVLARVVCCMHDMGATSWGLLDMHRARRSPFLFRRGVNLPPTDHIGKTAPTPAFTLSHTVPSSFSNPYPTFFLVELSFFTPSANVTPCGPHHPPLNSLCPICSQTFVSTVSGSNLSHLINTASGSTLSLSSHQNGCLINTVSGSALSHLINTLTVFTLSLNSSSRLAVPSSTSLP